MSDSFYTIEIEVTISTIFRSAKNKKISSHILMLDLKTQGS